MATATKPPRQKPYGGVYENIDFETLYGPKEFKEYPKAVVTDQRRGTTVIVQDAAEERQLRSSLQLAEDNAPPPAPEYAPDPAKQILISRAYELDIPINQKWSVKKLTEVIEAAENELDALPPETPHKPGQLPKAVLVEDDDAPAEPNQLLQKAAEPAKAKLALATPAAGKPTAEVKNDLILEANKLGINDPGMELWGIPRLNAAIAEAKNRKK